MTLTVVLILFLQIILIWLVAPLLIGIVRAVLKRNARLITAPYQELLANLHGTKQLSLIAWASLMVLALLIPSISLRAPLDWMSETVFMWAILLLSQLLVAKKSLKASIVLGTISWFCILLSAVFLGGSFHNTVLMSNGVVFSTLHASIGIALVLLNVLLWSRFVIQDLDKYDFDLWTTSTSIWMVILWASALIFPSTLALNWTLGSLGFAIGFLLIKFVVAVVLLLVTTMVHRLLTLRLTLALQIMLLVVSASVFSYLVLA